MLRDGFMKHDMDKVMTSSSTVPGIYFTLEAIGLVRFLNPICNPYLLSIPTTQTLACKHIKITYTSHQITHAYTHAYAHAYWRVCNTH